MTGNTFSQDIGIKNGVNIQASYYNNGRVNIGWELMQTYPEIEAVRIEIEPGLGVQARRWIREAHENGYQVIATYHNYKVLGTNDREELIKAANWWKKNYAALSSSGPIVINLMNEWGDHDIDVLDYAEAYNEAIDIIRPFYAEPIIVDVPGFGQATKIAADAYEHFGDQNIIYSIHVYTSAFNIEQKRWLSHSDLAYLDATGADCMVGEFCDNATGGADWCSIIDECYINGWPLFGWAWNGDGADMNMVEPFWRNEPLAQTFTPTEFMDVIVDKLAGRPCYTQPDEACNDSLIGESCDDNNDYTINDRYNAYCHCIGIYTSELQNNTTGSDLILYPNPLTPAESLTVELFKITGSGQLSIYNSMGALLWSRDVHHSEQRLSLDLSRFQSGVYWVSFHNEEHKLVTKSFILH